MSVKDDHYDHSLRVVTIGSPSAYAIIRRFVGETYTEPIPIVGINFLRKYQTVDGYRIYFQLFETAQEQRYFRGSETLKRAYFQRAGVLLLVFDVTNRKSLEDCREHYNTSKEVDKDGKSICIAVGAKIEMSDSREVTKEEAEEFFSQLEPSILYREVSTATGEGIDDLFLSAARMWLAQQGLPPEHNDNPSQNPTQPENNKSASSCVIC